MGRLEAHGFPREAISGVVTIPSLVRAPSRLSAERIFDPVYITTAII
jgi:hypothetical protein